MPRKFANRFFGDGSADENDDGFVTEPLTFADEDVLDSDMVVSDTKKPSSVNGGCAPLSLKPKDALKTAVFAAVERRIAENVSVLYVP